MKHRVTLGTALLFMSIPPMSILAGIPASAQHAPAASAAKQSQKLPVRAAREMERYRARTEREHRRHEATVEAEQLRLERTLRRELLATVKRRDFAGAQAILAAIKDLHASVTPKVAKPSDAAGAQARIEQALLGKWTVHCGPSFQTVWTFKRNGSVLSVNGAPQGHWRWERENRRILITWDETAWDSLNLPLNEKGTYGDTYHRQGWTVEAVKLL